MGDLVILSAREGFILACSSGKPTFSEAENERLNDMCSRLSEEGVISDSLCSPGAMLDEGDYLAYWGGETIDPSGQGLSRVTIECMVLSEGRLPVFVIRRNGVAVAEVGGFRSALEAFKVSIRDTERSPQSVRVFPGLEAVNLSL